MSEVVETARANGGYETSSRWVATVTDPVTRAGSGSAAIRAASSSRSACHALGPIATSRATSACGSAIAHSTSIAASRRQPGPERRLDPLLLAGVDLEQPERLHQLRQMARRGGGHHQRAVRVQHPAHLGAVARREDVEHDRGRDPSRTGIPRQTSATTAPIRGCARAARRQAAAAERSTASPTRSGRRSSTIAS